MVERQTRLLARLSPELEDVQRRWLGLERTAQDELYAEEFAQPFARLFAELPLCGAPADLEKPEALVSVLGLSWQPVALMAAWCKPKRMLVLGTKESFEVKAGDEGVLSIVARVAGIPRDSISTALVGDPGEEDIYRAVRDFVAGARAPGRAIFVDPTGGKKSMSSSASLAAFLLGAPLVYVDYGEYHGPKRIPIAGSEYPRLLANPLEVFGDLELRNVFAAFNRSDFREAENTALRLEARLYEPREAQCVGLLARGYGAWDSFGFGIARDALLQARMLIEKFAVRARWRWAESIRSVLDANCDALEALTKVTENPASVDDGLPLLAWYLAAAGRLIEAEKLSQAVMLTYAAVERYIDLCLWVDFGLDDEKPQYEKIADRLGEEERSRRYDAAGARLFGKAYARRELEGPIMFGNGAQLLAALAPKRLDVDDLGGLRGLSANRNQTEFEHGFLPSTPPEKRVQEHLEKAIALIERGLGGSGALAIAIERCRFPRLVT